MVAHEPDPYAELREAVRALCARFPATYFREVDRERGYPEAFVRALTEAGWLAALIPSEYGGSGLGLAEASMIMEEINRSGGNAGACHGQMYNMGTLLRHGSAAQKAEWLPQDRARRAAAAVHGRDRARRGQRHDPHQHHRASPGRPLAWSTARRSGPRGCSTRTSCCCSPAPRRWPRWRARRMGCRSSWSISAKRWAEASRCGRSPTWSATTPTSCSSTAWSCPATA